jgi:hypothetical protein
LSRGAVIGRTTSATVGPPETTKCGRRCRASVPCARARVGGDRGPTPQMMQMSSGEVYATYVSDCVLAETEYRRSLEQRGGMLITVSGALASALFALLAIVGAKGHPSLSTGLKTMLDAAVLTFAASAALAVGVASPLRAGQLDVASARREFRTVRR